jgi:hypothetical protein
MTVSSTLLSEYVEVRGRFRRSIHLEKDFVAAFHNGDYIVTPTAREALRRLSEGIGNASPYRAWTLTGPYGVGKSAFAVFLTHLFCSPGKQGQQTRRQLKDADPHLATQLRALGMFDTRSKGFLPVLATARRAPASKCLAEGIVAAASSMPNKKIRGSVQDLAEVLKSQRNGQPWDTRQIVNALCALSEAATSSGHEGVLVIVDELGKLFEYAARYPQKSDVFVLQELAEHAARSKSKPIFFVGLLHQSFQEYGLHLDQATRREWAKIQGRFEDIAFLEPAEQVVRMIAQAIRWTSDKGRNSPASYMADLVVAASRAGVSPPSMQKADFEATAKLAYPLHPVTLVALPFVFRRFAQNERSLFSYLSSLEPFGFQEFLKTHALTRGKPPVVRLGDLFDYFTKSFGAGLYRHPHAKRWLEASDILERKEGLSPLHREVVKTIGVLNALGEFSHLSATEEMVSIAVSDSSEADPEVRKVLNSLKGASIITYRKFNHTYRIWEGSDVDIEIRIAEGERKIRQGLNLANSVEHYLPTRPLVARRHSFKTGALRYFEVEYVDDPKSLEAHFALSDADGKVLVCLAESPVVAEHFRDLAIKSGERRDMLFAIPQLIGELRAVVTELGALRWAWDNTPELRDDRVARREISLRIAEADQLLRRSVDGLLDPRDEPAGSGCLWIYAGNQKLVRSPVDVSQLLSDVCDEIYESAPRIRNELIARRTLSAAAAAARRNLIERMLSHRHEEALGIHGYPPERSMYESVLRATGLHRQDKEGRWGFHAPDNGNLTKIEPAWNRLGDILFGRQPEPVALDRLFSELASPPIGALPGLHPVLLCAFMLAHPDETTLYRENSFLPEPSIADFEVLMRRPELFAVAGSRIAGGRALVVSRVATGLNVCSATVPVVRALFRMVKALPEFAWNTRQLPDTTITLREAFRHARSPEQFLFVLLPQALGLPAFSEDKPDSGELDRFFDLLNENLRCLAETSPRVVNAARDTLLKACGLDISESSWPQLREMAVVLEPTVTEPHLLAFLRRITQTGPDASGIESVLALVVDRPPRSWSDADVDRFAQAAATMGRAFCEATRSIGLKSTADANLGSLKPKELHQAEEILSYLHTYIRKIAKYKVSPRAIRAAIRRLIEELETNDAEG